MQAQDEAEYAEFVAALWQRMHRMAYAVCGDRALAEDAVQAALVSAYRAWPRVRDAASPESYLRKMVVNQLLSWRRRKSWITSARGNRPEPSRASHEDEVVEHQRVWSAVGLLPPRQRAVIVLRYYEGLSESEICEVLGIRPGTVKSQASAAQARLRATLADTETDPDVVVPAVEDAKGAR
jgi:RNA polymerase sigma-70 factor (sigma-E family)